jgi:hypothetical protein
MLKLACSLLAVVIGVAGFVDWGANKRNAESQKNEARMESRTNRVLAALNASIAGRHTEACEMYKSFLSSSSDVGLSDDEKATFEDDCRRAR